MKLLIEEEEYPIELLDSIFDDLKFYKQNGLKGTVKSVGYYHSFKKKEMVLMLPKVFMDDGVETVFKGTKDELYNSLEKASIKHDSKYQWLRELSIHFYNSLVEYNNRWNQTGLISPSPTFELNTNLGDNNYSYLDIVLSIVNFYNKNKNHILYRHVEHVTNKVTKPKWEKTIRKSLPMMVNSNTPIYFNIRNKRKLVNTEEELYTYFFSILNYLNVQNNLNLKVDKSYKIFKDDDFINLCKDEYGLRKLKKIKYRYFNDILKRMYQLCELYFSNNDFASSKKEKEEFLCTNNYNIIFEDMIDKLFTDKTDEENIQNLKKNKDGKLIDHIYEDKSLIDRSNIFFIGDSKYYKSDNTAGQNSKYKQITYAKNIIQYNIDLWNTKGTFHSEKIRYRDDITEGYNITPNFFIYGHIEDPNDFEKSQIMPKTSEKPEVSYHWVDRLFDRDTIFVHQYSINFLFVLKSYTSYNSYKLKSFRDYVKKKFRTGFINYFNNSEHCGFTFYECTLQPSDFPNYIRNNFKDFNGKSIITEDNRLIIAIHQNDDSLNKYLENFELLGCLL